ncbi:hypothetical protein JCM6882_005550 [Rhodosporidiobolus microsporus]
MADWAALKAKRAAKPSSSPANGVRAVEANSSNPADASVRNEASASRAPAPEVVPYCHPDLPSSLEVRKLAGRGRGVVAKQAIPAGTTLLQTAPLLSVLDNRNLATHCSFCFRSQDDTPTQKPLSQCSLCHIVQYCSAACQQADWKLHKVECKALRGVAVSSGRRIVPDTPIRALGRLLWKKELEGEKLWSEIESLQSHREALSPEEQERFFQLSVALAQYVGSQDLVSKAVGGSGRGMMDFCSRFTSNSFSLTSPSDVTNIGVSISPLTALFNHSCAPNAVVVFPSFPSPSQPRHMEVIALRDIKPGDEVLTSYVDLALPGGERRRELKERYHFDCDCEECEPKEGRVDPREAVECQEKGCGALIALPTQAASSTTSSVSCSTCGTVASYKDVYLAVDAAKQALADAEKVQYSDPKLATLHLQHLITSLTTSLSPSPPLAASTYPLLPAYQLLLTLQLHSSLFSTAHFTALTAYRGASLLYPPSHPVLAVLLSTLARLETIPPPAEAGPAAEMAYWGDEPRRAKGIARVVRAIQEAEGAFGRKSGGGEMEKRLRALLRDQEEGVAMARKVRAAGMGA